MKLTVTSAFLVFVVAVACLVISYGKDPATDYGIGHSQEEIKEIAAQSWETKDWEDFSRSRFFSGLGLSGCISATLLMLAALEGRKK